MKNIIFFLALFTAVTFAHAQQKEKEEAIFGIQTGILGIWGHGEYEIYEDIFLRTEIGFDFGILGGDLYNSMSDNPNFLMVPSIGIGARWYYNLKKRIKQNKNVLNNSGNFISLKATYNPDWFMIPDDSNIVVVDQVSLIPKWALKRNIWRNLSYEIGAGMGYRFLLNHSYSNEVAVDLHLRIGYTF